MIEHELKTWTPFFTHVWNSTKRFEVRKDDRGFKVGGQVILREYNNELKGYTGYEVRAVIDYVLKGGQFGIEDGYCILSIVVMSRINKSVTPNAGSL